MLFTRIAEKENLASEVTLRPVHKLENLPLICPGSAVGSMNY